MHSLPDLSSPDFDRLLSIAKRVSFQVFQYHPQWQEDACSAALLDGWIVLQETGNWAYVYRRALRACLTLYGINCGLLNHYDATGKLSKIYGHKINVNAPLSLEMEDTEIGSFTSSTPAIEEPDYARIEEDDTFDSLLDNLPTDLDRQIFQLRFRNDLTFTEIGVCVGKSSTWVRKRVTSMLPILGNHIQDSTTIL